MIDIPYRDTKLRPQVSALCLCVLLVVVGPASQPDHDQQQCYHHAPTVNLRLLL